MTAKSRNPAKPRWGWTSEGALRRLHHPFHRFHAPWPEPVIGRLVSWRSRADFARLVLPTGLSGCPEQRARVEDVPQAGHLGNPRLQTGLELVDAPPCGFGLLVTRCAGVIEG